MVDKILINVRSFKKQQLPEAALTQLKTSDFCKLRSIFNVDVSKCFFSQNKIHQPPNIRNHTAVLGAKSDFRNKQDVIVYFDEYRVSRLPAWKLCYGNILNNWDGIYSAAISILIQ